MTMDSGAASAASADKDIDGRGNTELAPETDKVVHQKDDNDPGRVSFFLFLSDYPVT